MIIRKEASEGFAVASILVGAGLWGVIWFPMRLIEARGLDGLWLTLIMYAAAFGVGGTAALRGARDSAWPWPRIALLALASGWTNIAFVLAILDGNVMRVMFLFYLSPFWAVLLGRVFLGERLGLDALKVLVPAALGAWLLLKGPGFDIPWPTDLTEWLALSSGLAFAVSNVTTRGLDQVTLGVKVATVWVGVLIVAGAWILLAGAALPVVDGVAFTGAFLLGAVAIVALTTLVQYGVTHLPIQRSSVLMLFELVTAAVSQHVFTDEAMRAAEWAGGVLIGVAAVLAARRPVRGG